MKIKPIILCGGEGTRLWPESRKKHPKQFIKINGKSLLKHASNNACAFVSARFIASTDAISPPAELLP